MTVPAAVPKERVILDCAKCGEFALQSIDFDAQDNSYYCHCFNGDCGAIGPRGDEDGSVAEWNALQSSLIASLGETE